VKPDQAAKPDPATKPDPAAGKSPPDPEGIAALIDDQGGECPIAGKLPELFREAGEGGPLRAGEEFFAGVIYLLGQEEFSEADKLLSYIEEHTGARSGSASAAAAFTWFLRGEYHYFGRRKGEAEAHYREAAGKNDAFWPAFYRLSALAAEGNPVQYEYKTRKALESIEKGREKRYEVFIGGFSPDYYRQALEKRLS
jgi:hypothetical protein